MYWDTNPFAITPDEVQALSAERQVALLNQIIRNRASHLDLPSNQIRTTRRTNNADGGVDALVNTGLLSDRVLGTGLSVWQYKKSFPTFDSKKEPRSEIAIELAKSGVQDAFQVGAGYTLAVGEQATPKKAEDLTRKLADFAKRAGCEGQVRLFVADDIADWATDDPAVLLQIRPMLNGMRLAEAELHSERHSTEFDPDQPRAGILSDIANRLFSTDASTFHIRVNGLAGVGKSRLALEAADRNGISNSTFYTAEPVSPDFFALVAARPQATANIIIDECDAADHGRYIQLAEPGNGRIRIITVGPGAQSGQDIHTLAPLDVNVVEQIIVRQTNLPAERARWVAQKTRGYVKLAVLVGSLVNRGSTNILELSNDLEISKLVQNLISSNEKARIALRGVALLSRVGFQGDLETEGRVVAEFVGLSWNEFCTALVDAINQGIVSVRGRYWYVSPELLAIWLAGDFWRAHPGRLGELIDLLPTPVARAACIKRISTLGDSPEMARVVAADLLGPAGAFRQLSDVSDNSTARVFTDLAKGYPAAGVVSLQRIIGAASDEELRAFTTGRQEIVWSLRSLIARKETFIPAARLLRRLAETENETRYSNNATDYWAKAFLIQLGQTECPAPDRIPLIDESLASELPKVRLLGAVALRSMLCVYESAGIETPDQSIPPKYWQAATYGQIAEIKREAFKRLLPLISDPDLSIREEARATLKSESTGLVRLGLIEEVLTAYKLLEAESEEERRDTWEAIRHIQIDKQSSLTGEQKRDLQELAGRYFDDSLVSRIKRYMGPRSPANWDDDNWSSRKHDECIASLASEANQSEEWIGLLGWLTSGDAHYIHPFATRLGEVDTARRWLGALEDAAVGSPDPRILAFYLRGWSSLGETESAQVEQRLDEWSQRKDYAGVVADATLRLPPSERGAIRLLTMVGAGYLDASFFGWLRIGDWIRVLSSDLIVDIMICLLNDQSALAISSALRLGERISEHFGAALPDDMRSVLWQLLEQPLGWDGDFDNRYVWHRLAEKLGRGEELRIVRLLVEVATSTDLGFEDERLKLLLTAIKKHPRETLEHLTPLLIESPTNYKFQWAVRDLGLFESLDFHVVQDWIANIGVTAAQAVSESVRVNPGALSPLTRYLLVNFNEVAEDGLTRQYLSGGWTGSAIPFWTTRLESARVWTDDPAPNVRAWALQLISYLEPTISSSRVREAEEWWDRG